MIDSEAHVARCGVANIMSVFVVHPIDAFARRPQVAVHGIAMSFPPHL